MGPLIQIISHEGGRTWRQAIRETWLKDQINRVFGCHYHFVVGEHDPQEPDTITVDAPDDYSGISRKVKEALRVAYDGGYTHVFNCFTDTFVSVPRLLLSGFEQWDYTGHVPCVEFPGPIGNGADAKGRFAYASGGCGYWLSRRAIEVIINSEPRSEYDDLWVGWELGLNGICCCHDPRYGFKGEHLYNKQQITVHLSQGTGIFDPAWMYRAQRRLKA